MVKEYNISQALALYPDIRKHIPKELIREFTTDEKYIVRIQFDADQKIELVEFGYETDEEWTLKA